MRFSKSLLAAVFATSSHIVSAFSISGRSVVSRARPVVAPTLTPSVRPFCSSTSVNMANVMKLTDPKENLLDEVDVFIFDCDGVIWRVRHATSCE